MTNRIEEAFSNYKINKMIDPATRYSNDEREVFAAGWKITIGCWANKTLEDLRAIVEGDDWPESKGVERERLRPIMAGVLALRLLLEGKK